MFWYVRCILQCFEPIRGTGFICNREWTSITLFIIYASVVTCFLENNYRILKLCPYVFLSCAASGTACAAARSWPTSAVTCSASVRGTESSRTLRRKCESVEDSKLCFHMKDFENSSFFESFSWLNCICNYLYLLT